MSLYRLKVKVNFTLDQAMKVQEGNRAIALLFNLGARCGWIANATPRPPYPGRDPEPIQDGGWATAPVWTGVEKLGPTAMRYADRS